MAALGWFNVRSAPYNATGDGVTNDATAINSAVTAAQSAGGGVVYFPAGHYIYNGAGIVNDPATNVTQHLFLVGDGRGASILDFTACSNSQCVLLDNQNAVGSGRNDGSGVRDLTLIAPSGKPALVIADLENWIVSSVNIYGGTIALTVKESRKGTVENCVLQAFSVDGIKITGESFASNVYKDITISSAASSTGAGVRYDRTGTADSGGATFVNVGINSANVGFQFTGTSLHDAFLFLRGCVVDGALDDDGFKLVKVRNVVLLDCWSVVQQSNKAAVRIDGCDYVTLLGGSFYAGGGGTAADLSFANTCANVAVAESRLTGPTLAVRVDSTTQGVDLRPATVAASLTNDATKLSPGRDHGTYTPTLFNVANIAATTSHVWQWQRTGNVVTASGQVSIQASAGGSTTTKLGISLPIASNLAAQTECSGSGVVASGSNQAVLVYGDATNTRAEISYLAIDAQARSLFLHLTYFDQVALGARSGPRFALP